MTTSSNATPAEGIRWTLATLDALERRIVDLLNAEGTEA